MPMIDHKVYIVLFCVVLFALYLLFFTSKTKAFVGSRKILTDCEAFFLRHLDKVCHQRNLNYRVMAKVRVADLVEMNPALKGKQFWKHFKKVSQTHIDFVLLDPKSFETVLVIELDDSSHLTRKEADSIKDHVFQEINIPLLRVKPKRSYSNSELINQIQGLKENV